MKIVVLTVCIHLTVTISQLTIPGFEYTARTFAQNKKDAETAAAKDFCGYLIGAGLIPAESIPDSVFVSTVYDYPISCQRFPR